MGQHKNDEITGFGVITWYRKDGSTVSIYEGNLKSFKFHGHGKKTTFDGDGKKIIWEGEYKNSKKNGKGVLIYPDGKRLEGEWVDDNIHGAGIWFGLNGIYELTMHYRNGELYETEDMRLDCAKEAGEAGTEYAAKKIEKICLAKVGLEP